MTGVLIVAKCNVNNHERLVQAVLTVVLIVAKCNVNVRSVLKLYFLKQSINSSKV